MQTQEQLNLNDLKLMAQIIKVVSARGAIQADEMSAVGNLYNKLAAFIEAASPKPEEPTDATESTAAPQDENASEGEATNG